MKRGFLDISFAWLFGIIAGATIIIISVFAATKIIHLGQQQVGAGSQAQLGTLLNPLQTGFQSGEISSLLFPAETRIYNQCNTGGNFGEDIISVSQQSLNQWPVPTSGTAFQDKYLFSQNITQGKSFYLFSKPFNFPFKVADLIYMTSSEQNYCFVNPPQNVNDELSNLNEGNIILSTGMANCTKNSITVCFDGSPGCNLSVDYSGGTVTNSNGTVMTFPNDALMYGAIFSNPGVYECQVQRLMERGMQLNSLYQSKINMFTAAGCNNMQNLGQDLSGLSSSENSVLDSSQPPSSGLALASTSAATLDSDNSGSPCPLY